MLAIERNPGCYGTVVQYYLIFLPIGIYVLEVLLLDCYVGRGTSLLGILQVYVFLLSRVRTMIEDDLYTLGL